MGRTSEALSQGASGVWIVRTFVARSRVISNHKRRDLRQPRSKIVGRNCRIRGAA
jgi:hypothetical protein